MENKKIWAYLFSFFPGAGHLYLGIQKKGLQLMALFLVVIFLNDLTNIDSLIFLGIVLCIYSIFDVRKILYLGANADESLDFNFNFNGNLPKIIAWVLIIIGIWSIVSNVLFPIFNIQIDYKIRGYVKTVIGSIILILLGLKLIKGNKNY